MPASSTGRLTKTWRRARTGITKLAGQRRDLQSVGLRDRAIIPGAQRKPGWLRKPLGRLAHFTADPPEESRMHPLYRIRCTVALLAMIVMGPLAAQQGAARGAQAGDAEALATTLVARMTTEEKLAQLLNTAPAIERLDVPPYNWWTESLHGAMGSLPTTNFPEPIGLAASFDDALVQRVAAVISTEVRGLHALARQTGRSGRIGTGLNTWSPNINIFRDPRWGRGQETYGEDPFLAARMGVAYVRGMQGAHPEWIDVVATPKHYAVHSGPESTRHEANVFVSRRDLEDTYLPAFRAAIVEGGAGSVM